MSDFIQGIQVGTEVKQYDYDALGNKPDLVVVDDTLSKGGRAADAKVVGDKFKEVTTEFANRDTVINQINTDLSETNTEVTNIKHSVLDTNTKVDNLQDSIFGCANALRGTVSDVAVRLDYVSPVEHNIKVLATIPEDVDPTSVAITTYGKNLLNFVPYTTNDEGTTTVTFKAPTIPVGTTIYIHGYFQDGTELEPGNSAFVFRKGSTQVLNTSPNSAVLVTEDVAKADTVAIYTNTTVAGKKVAAFQLEIGDTASEYEEYKEPQTYTLSEDGTVAITSLYPTVTIVTNVLGVTVGCEYNKDTNAVIKKLTDAIVALGGTV